MYRLILTTANIAHKMWYKRMNNRKALYTFNTIDELVNFMRKYIPVLDREIEFIRNNDLKKRNGGLACTSWYSIEKGEHLMTEYTSL